VHREGSLKRRRELIGRVDLQPASAERLGKWHNVDRAELHTGSAAVLGHFLETDHVIRPVNPHQVDEVAFEPGPEGSRTLKPDLELLGRMAIIPLILRTFMGLSPGGRMNPGRGHGAEKSDFTLASSQVVSLNPNLEQ
jgi:hypothetical protein